MRLLWVFLDLLEIEARLLPFLLLALVLALALRKAPAACSCLLWWGVFLRLACPFFVPAPAKTSATPAPAAGLRPFPVLPAGGTSPEPNLVIGMSEPRSLGPGWDLLAIIWLAGMAGILLWNLISYLRFRRTLVGAVRLRDNIWLGDSVPVPVVVGLLRPKIYLPSALEGREREYVILHEQSHIRRKDPWLKLLGWVLAAVHWFDPLVWLALVLACRDMEAACDQRVLRAMGEGLRQEYSASVLSPAAGRRIPMGPLAFGEAGEIKGRIRRLLEYRDPPKWARRVAAGAVAGALAFAILLPGTARAVPAGEGEPARIVQDPAQPAQEPSRGTITFPAYREGREDYNAAVYDIKPFRVALTLPEGWSVRVPPAEERRTSFAFTPLWLYQGEEYAGSIGYNTFELYPDVPEEGFYRMVYNQLMLGSVLNWDNDYTVIRELDTGNVATVQIMERRENGSTALRPGILAYDRDQLVYVAIDLQNGSLSSQEVLELAASLEILPQETE